MLYESPLCWSQGKLNNILWFHQIKAIHVLFESFQIFLKQTESNRFHMIHQETKGTIQKPPDA